MILVFIFYNNSRASHAGKGPSNTGWKQKYRPNSVSMMIVIITQRD
jgi:hypothetical protein